MNVLKWGPLIGALILAVPDAIWAQSLFTENYYGYSHGYGASMMLARTRMMALSIGAGFAIGWFFSPQAREFRRFVGLLIGGGAILIAIFHDGALGWSLAWLVSVLGFFFAIGYWLGRGVRSFFHLPSTFGSSQWADVEHMEEKELFGDEGLILGRAFNGEESEVFSYKGDRHLFTFGPTRSQKGTAHIIPNLLTYEGSMVVIDPKGENALITAAHRMAMGQEVYLFDPWNIAASQVGVPPARFNPVNWLDIADIDAPENAMLLADALVQPPVKAEPFWSEESRAAIQGAALDIAFAEEYDGYRSLGTLRDVFLQDDDDLKKTFQRMANSPHHLVASTGARFLQKDPKLLSNVLASLQSETHFLDSPRLREALSASDFRFEDLKRKPMTIYIILPADRLHTFNRVLRLLIQQALTITARDISEKPEKPVLFILDEMAALGRLKMVEEAYGLMAGFGLQLWGIAPDLCQLRRVYGEDYETFIANAGAVSYFGSPDKTNAEYFSALCGVTTVWNFSSAIANTVSSGWGPGGANSGSSTTYTDNRAFTQRKLAFPDELMRMRAEQQLVLIDNVNPILAQKMRWYEEPTLAPLGVNLHAK